MEKLDGTEKAGANDDGSKKLTSADFKELINVLQESRTQKK